MAALRQNVVRPPQRHEQPQQLVGASECINRLGAMVESLAQRNCTVLIHGESGTGKELIARCIHEKGVRRDGPFVPVDCTTLRDTLFESQLFGHVKGAFTGAEHATLGFFRSADGGTLFLDEIGEMGLAVQAKLLRCIQERAVVPLGGVAPIPVDVRIIAATHRDLKAMVRRGEFRQDLYYRLNVVPLTVPPLRERIADLPALAEHFLAQFAELHGGAVKELSPDALAALRAYDWPGNVRELANVMEQVHVLAAHDFVTAADLPEDIQAAGRESAACPAGEIVPLAVMERSLVAQALRAAGGNQSRAAQLLQIDRRRLYRKVRSYKLQALTQGATD